MHSVPDMIKSLTRLNVRSVQRMLSLHWPISFQRLERTPDIEHKLLQTRSRMNYRAFLSLNFLTGLYLPTSSADSAPQGSKCDCTYAKHFCTKFPEGDMDHYGFRTGLNVSEILILPSLSILQTKRLTD
jgi:hypothetical protein